MTTYEPITVVSGTNRKNSLTKIVATYYLDLLKQRGCDVSQVDLVDLPADFTSTALYENKGKNEAFNLLANKIEDGTKFVFVYPEYNGSYPGVLKAFIDGLNFPGAFKGKKCALVGVSRGIQGCVLGTSHLTSIFNYLGMYVYPFKLKLSSIPNPELEELLSNDKYIELLEEQAKGFLEF